MAHTDEARRVNAVVWASATVLANSSTHGTPPLAGLNARASYKRNEAPNRLSSRIQEAPGASCRNVPSCFCVGFIPSGVSLTAVGQSPLKPMRASELLALVAGSALPEMLSMRSLGVA